MNKKKICLVNLGCKVNQYELDGIMNSLTSEFDVVSGLAKADIYVVNTCAVTTEAERKSRQYIAKILKLNPNAEIFVYGCAAQNNPEQFLKFPQVKYVGGNSKKGQFKNSINSRGNFVCPLPLEYEDDLVATGVRTRGYVKIQDGCNNFCSYCLIPYVRGRSRSRALSSIVREATLLSKTCGEIVLTGINVSDYRIDGNLALPQVFKALSHLPCRIRMSSFEVNIVTKEFLEVVSKLDNFCPHFHLSLQSGSDKVLRDMNRHYTTSEFLEKVDLIRQYFDNPAITTDLIVGFPTETEEDFDTTLAFLKKVGFSSVHYFAYSSRKGTLASKKYKALNGDIIREREHKLKQVVQDLKTAYLKSSLATPQEVLVEETIDGYSEGFSKNYIRCYIEGDFAENSVQKVTPVSLFKDGLLCKITT